MSETHADDRSPCMAATTSSRAITMPTGRRWKRWARAKTRYQRSDNDKLTAFALAMMIKKGKEETDERVLVALAYCSGSPGEQSLRYGRSLWIANCKNRRF